MSNEATTEAVQAEEAIQEADNIMWGRDPDAEGAPSAEPLTDPDDPDAEPAEGPPADPKPKDDPAPDDEPKPSEKGEDDGETDDDEPKPKAIEHAQIRRQRRQVKRYQDELQASQQQFRRDQETFEAERRAFMAERDTQRELRRTNPEAAWAADAKASGLDPDEYFRSVTERRIGEGPGNSELTGRMAHLEAELKRRDAADQKRRDDTESQQKQHGQTQAIQSDMATITDALAQPEYAQKYPHLAAMHPKARATHLHQALVWATGQAVPMRLDEICTALDDDAAERYSHMQQGLGHPASSDEKPAGQAPPASRAKPGAGRRRTVSNTDTAASGGTRREMTDEERLLAADADIVGWSSAQVDLD